MQGYSNYLLKEILMKRRFYKTVTRGKESIDQYPEIDFYIPEATSLTNSAIGIREEINSAKWGAAFLKNMDKILVKEGLRVI